MQAPRFRERRRSRRIKIGQPLRLRPSDPREPEFTDICTTKNVSPDGFYFLTNRHSYRVGMRLFVTLPHHSPKEPHDHDYIGQVARVEPLDNDQRGVAVQILISLSKPIC